MLYNIRGFRVVSSSVERFSDKEEVDSSILSRPTNLEKRIGIFFIFMLEENIDKQPEFTAEQAGVIEFRNKNLNLFLGTNSIGGIDVIDGG